ncbi:MAG: DUF2156 domain-containing protein [Bacteroidetes bacterium]|nr:DUF2156 domain-containing protein [Bacteroidota bacterium]
MHIILSNSSPAFTFPARLPLSWRLQFRQQPGQMAQQCSPVLPLSGQKWLAWMDIWPQQDFWQPLIHPDVPLYIRGVPRRLAARLRQLGWQLLPQGVEFVLDANHQPLRQAGLQKLVDRGMRKVYIQEEPVNSETEHLLAILSAQSPHAGKKQLRYLFRSQVGQCDRLWLARTRDSRKPLAAISVTRNGAAYWHTEQWVRHRQAPVGCMEALVVHIHQILAAQGHSLSLGEVPFWPKERYHAAAAWVAAAGRWLSPVYAAAGLFRFKQKFGGRPLPLYLASSHHSPLWALPDVYVQCGLPLPTPGQFFG